MALLMMAAGGPLSAQVPVRAPSGTLTGMVRDSATGKPVGYALVLVVGKPQRVFASESGRFVLIGLGSGALTLRVQQIGFRAATLSLTLDTSEAPGGGALGLEVTLARRPVVLPEVVVHGDVCTGTEALAGSDAQGETVIDEALKNAERILVLEKSYPFRAVFQQVSVQLDDAERELGRQVDTLRYDTRGQVGYRKGRVLQGRRGPGEVANYFTTSDLVRDDFRKWHCFWYAGKDTTDEGQPAHRIEFAPLEKTRSPDWAGSLLIDPTTMMLVGSEARLVNLRNRETTFQSARCAVRYREIIPTLMVESTAECNIRRLTRQNPRTVSRWELVLFAFVGKSPVTAAPP